MASSKKPRPNNACPVLSAVEQQIVALGLNFSSNVLLAFSGGLDSSVLLHALWQIRQKFPFQLSAMHVHHGLSFNANDWAIFCQHICERYLIPFTLEKVVVDCASSLGIEAAAREARYRVLMGVQTDWLFLAQHKDDQAETLLLQLARGAGVKVLSGMAAADVGRRIVRPLLSLTRGQLERYAKQHQLEWVEDESNVSTAFDRNWWRTAALPLLKKRYPAIVETLSRSARHLAEASALLDDLAELDAAQCIHAPRLDLALFAMLSEARQRNLLRWWLQQHGIQAISEARMLQSCSQLCRAGMKKSIHVNVGSGMEIRTYLEGAYLLASRPVYFSAPQDRPWQGEPIILLEDGSRLEFKKVIGQGIAMHLLHQPLYVRFRQGGEKVRLETNRPSRGLKAVFQQHRIPPWQREHIPLLYLGNDLVAIPGVGYAAQCRPQANETGIAVRWMPE